MWLCCGKVQVDAQTACWNGLISVAPNFDEKRLLDNLEFARLCSICRARNRAWQPHVRCMEPEALLWSVSENVYSTCLGPCSCSIQSERRNWKLSSKTFWFMSSIDSEIHRKRTVGFFSQQKIIYNWVIRFLTTHVVGDLLKVTQPRGWAEIVTLNEILLFVAKIFFQSEFLSFSKSTLLIIKNVSLLNFQFHCSDGTEHEHSHKHWRKRSRRQTSTQLRASSTVRVIAKPYERALQIEHKRTNSVLPKNRF